MPNDLVTQTSEPTSPTTTPPTNPAPAAPPAAAPADATPAPTSLLGGTAVEPPVGEGTGQPSPITLEDIALPEGFVMPEAEGAEFLALLNEPPEDRKQFASSLLEVHNKILQQVAEGHAQAWERTQSEWQDTIRALPEFAGDRLEPAMAQIAGVVDRYGDAQLREALALTGAGNHPAVARFMLKIAQDLNEAPPVKGGPATSPAPDRASRMFGNKGA
jgi:hypothetical protein